jgi:dTDP-4-dehydrorhamnose 3,5-epimerase
MKIIVTPIEDLVILEPDIYKDDRGFFMETYNDEKYQEVLKGRSFVQDNFSYSKKGVIRGMHLQIEHSQGKLVSVVAGSVYDVAVDLRANSSTFGQCFGIELSSENFRQLWIPPGFAHGFQTISDYAKFTYKCTELYDPSDEECLKWNDIDLSICWKDIEPIVSEKDSQGLTLCEFKQKYNDGIEVN